MSCVDDRAAELRNLTKSWVFPTNFKQVSKLLLRLAPSAGASRTFGVGVQAVGIERATMASVY